MGEDFNFKESRKAGEMMEYNPDAQEDLGMGGKLKNWLQDNVRIILSVLIVVAIAGGIYSYSKREVPMSDEEIAMQEETSQSNESAQQPVDEKKSNESVTIIGEEEKADQQKTEEPKKEDLQAQKDGEVQQPKAEQKEEVKINGDGVQQSTSEETEESFTETAVRGDSATTMARKALKDYLEKNNDSSLTAEHKIYIEDYLRKHADHKGGVAVGEKISFSKTMIKDAIEKSKTLNENQLKNLKKYSSRVSGL